MLARREGNMNRERRLKILCLTFASCVAVQLLATEPKDPTPARASYDKQQVLQLEDDWVVAESKRDATTLRRILDDKFIASFGANKPIDKETFIREIVSSDVDPSVTQTLTDRMVIVDNDTAVVVGTDTQRGMKNDAAYAIVARYSATYIRRNGHWLALGELLVKVPGPK